MARAPGTSYRHRRALHLLSTPGLASPPPRPSPAAAIGSSRVLLGTTRRLSLAFLPPVAWPHPPKGERSQAPRSDNPANPMIGHLIISNAPHLVLSRALPSARSSATSESAAHMHSQLLCTSSCCDADLTQTLLTMARNSRLLTVLCHSYKIAAPPHPLLPPTAPDGCHLDTNHGHPHSYHCHLSSRRPNTL